MTYRAPVDDMAATLLNVSGLKELMEAGAFPELSEDLLRQVLDEAGRFAGEVLAPLQRVGDENPARLDGGKVVTPPGFADAYRQWVEAGWGSIPADPAFGGQGLPLALSAACQEMWNAACLSFGLCPILSQGAVEAIAAHGTEEQKERYLEKLVTGAWTGTMNLTEPQAGSDLSALRTKAVPQSDGSYKITGTKIYITYGDHDMTDNIVHLVLARLPDAPSGTRGISLFLVPKFLLNGDGTPGDRNDVACVGLEDKLGIHGSPTCVMSYGDEGGATGFLLGEENRGLAAMFTMMNNARLLVGLQGVAQADRATQLAQAYAAERRQGRRRETSKEAEMEPIAVHPDVQRMLMTMKAATEASRAICYVNAAAIDAAHHGGSEEVKKRGQRRADLLTPVAKAWSTDKGVEVASLGMQVHGGMGYVEESGAAQIFRDARIAPIYEGTNGIQAIDLVTRKLPMDEGGTVKEFLGDLKEIAEECRSSNDSALGAAGTRLGDGIEALEEAGGWLLGRLAADEHDDALAGAHAYSDMFGRVAGGAFLAKGALEAGRAENGNAVYAEGKKGTARFFAETSLAAAPGLLPSVTAGASMLKQAGMD